MFNFFKRANNDNPMTKVNGINLNSAVNLPDIQEQVFTEQAPSPPGHFSENVPTAAEHNIGLLYDFLDRNHEIKGYDDALLNPDSSHLNQNVEALKNELVRILNRVRTFYEDFIQETDFHILSRSRSGMIDMVEELEMKKKIALGHIEKVKAIEAGAELNGGEGAGVLISYTRGFKNGLAAISHHHILTKKF